MRCLILILVAFNFLVEVSSRCKIDPTTTKSPIESVPKNILKVVEEIKTKFVELALENTNLLMQLRNHSKAEIDRCLVEDKTVDINKGSIEDIAREVLTLYNEDIDLDNWAEKDLPNLASIFLQNFKEFLESLVECVENPEDFTFLMGINPTLLYDHSLIG